MPSAITNCYDPNEKRSHLDIERTYLYRPQTKWTYSHHPAITHFANRFHAIWSNGRENEDDVGQRILTSSSADFHTWTAPHPLVDTQPGKHAEKVLTAAGFHQHDGQLATYFGRYEYDPTYLIDGHRPTANPADKGHRNTGFGALTTRDGKTWSDLLDLDLPIVPNHPPQPTASGRLILSGNIMFPYTDDPTGLSSWQMTGIYPDTMTNRIYDDSEGFWKVKEEAGWDQGLCEGSFYQTDDGVLHMLLRSHQQLLWVTESRDDGRTWSSPKPTTFTDVGTKFHFGRLPDGRFYYVGCPDPKGWRNPLVLSLSEDGIRFDRHYIITNQTYEKQREGLHKGGEYGYPHTLLHKNHLYIIVSRVKEAIEVIRFSIDQL